MTINFTGIQSFENNVEIWGLLLNQKSQTFLKILTYRRGNIVYHNRSVNELIVLSLKIPVFLRQSNQQGFLYVLAVWINYLWIELQYKNLLFNGFTIQMT